MCNLCGIYLITCLVTGRIYVGSSVDVWARIQSHKSLLARGTHRNPFLQNAWNKYGPEAFTFEVIAKCKPKERFKVEQRWITKLCAVSKGFNIANPVQLDTPSPRMSEVSKLSWANQQTRVNRNSGIGFKWNESEFRERKLKDGAKARAALAEKRKDPVWRAAVAAKTSATLKARAQTVEGKAHLEFASVIAHNRRRKDPEFKARCEAGLGKRKKSVMI